MNNDDLEKKLENMSKPQFSELPHQQQLKISILNAKKSAWAALWLMLLPFLIFIGAAVEAFAHISIPPWSWLKEYSPQWPEWLRMSVFITAVMIFPLVAVILNVLSITWLQYDRGQKILHISIKMKTVNLIIIIIAGLLAVLFIGHSIADSIAGLE